MFRVAKIAILICTLAMVITLTGCQRADYAENQAYVVMLGVDTDEQGRIILTIKYPKLSGGTGGAAAGGSGDSSSYNIAEAEGAMLQDALNNLRVSVPREMNLSALSMIVVSRAIIDNGMLIDTLEQIATNYRMYSAAYIAVCADNAGEFIKSQEPQIGSRLSQGIKALIENAEKLGSVPDSRIADVLYSANSVYSDPIIMECRLDEDKEGKQKNIYSGSYVIRDGRTALSLDENETVLANMLMGKVKQFSYVYRDNAAFVSVDKKPVIKVSVEDGIRITVDLSLSALLSDGNATVYEYAEMMRKDIVELIERCCNAEAEPFGFAEIAAGKFTTLEKWIEFDWRRAFADCNVEVNISLNKLF